MKRRKKLPLLLLVIILLLQIPFAYRHYKLGRLHSAIQLINSQRFNNRSDGDFTEYRGVLHVHSFLGGHSTGSFGEIIAAARKNTLDFVVMTEHTAEHLNTAEMTLKGIHAGVLFINGNEVSTLDRDRLLIIPGSESAGETGCYPTRQVVSEQRARGALTFLAYPESRSWDAESYDGVEVYNLDTNARKINPFVMFFDGLWSYGSYPDLLFANFYTRPAESLKKWDNATAGGTRRLVAVSGNDAHANIGIGLNDSSGKTLLGLRLDPYERSFRLVRVHVLIPQDKYLDAETLLAAIASGHCFIGFDLFADSSGFRFTAASASEKKIQGDEIALENGIRLSITAPVTSRIVLLRDGNVIQNESGITHKEFAISERGTYRVEVYLPQLPSPVSDQPWILSNPIYVR